MDKLLSILIILSVNSFCFSQIDANKGTDYTISAKLDSLSKKIYATELVTFRNNSNEIIDKTVFQLWANAYSSSQTSYAQLLLKNGNTSMYFADESKFGAYENIEFYQNDKLLHFEYKDDDKQIIELKLNNPVKSGEEAYIKIKYTLKLPENFNGFGYNDDKYFNTLWYPKMAIYENNDWKYYPLNIYNMDYNDFGNYKISVQIPKNQIIVGSSDIEKILESSEDDIVLKSENGYKIVKFKDNFSNDFVWFSSPEFNSETYEFSLDNNYKYKVNVYGRNKDIGEMGHSKYQKLFKNILTYVDSINRNGLPKEINLLVDKNAINQSYPNIVTIKKISDKNKERILKNFITLSLINDFNVNSIESPWILNGLSLYYQWNYRYFWPRKYNYKGKRFSSFSNLVKYRNCCPAEFQSAYNSIDSFKLRCEFIFNMQYKSVIAFHYLDYNSNKNELNNSLKQLYYANQYKNIELDTFKSYLQKYQGDKMNWLFEQVLNEKQPFQYSIENFINLGDSMKFSIENKGNINMPYTLKIYDKDNVLKTIKSDGHENKIEYTYPNRIATKIELKPLEYSVNNNIRTRYYVHNNLLNKFPDLVNLKYTKSRLFPMLGFNESDGLQYGALMGLSNLNLYNVFGFIGYGNKSKEFVGFGKMNSYFKINEKSNIIGTLFYSHFNKSRFDDTKLSYSVLNPNVIYNFSKSNCGNTDLQEISYSFYYIKEEAYGIEGVEKYPRYLNVLKYTFEKNKTLSKTKFQIGLENQYYTYYEKHKYIQINGSLDQKFMYKSDRFIKFRFYGATYLYNTHTNYTGNYPGTLSLIGYNINQYTYDEPLFGGRTAQEGFWTRQLTMGTGNFKSAISNSYGIGQSNKYVCSMNLELDLPFNFFLKPYADFGIYGDLPTVNEGYQNTFIYSIGLLMRVEKNILISFPLINSKVIEDAYSEMYKHPILGKISFYIDMGI
ncbi:MAG: hypothetical protein R2771_10570 [Saprospiraceae bacterium]